MSFSFNDRTPQTTFKSGDAIVSHDIEILHPIEHRWTEYMSPKGKFQSHHRWFGSQSDNSQAIVISDTK